jgi:hypothetical protein
LFLENPAPYIRRFEIEDKDIIADRQQYQVDVPAEVRANALRIAMLESCGSLWWKMELEMPCRYAGCRRSWYWSASDLKPVSAGR